LPGAERAGKRQERNKQNHLKSKRPYNIVWIFIERIQLT